MPSAPGARSSRLPLALLLAARRADLEALVSQFLAVVGEELDRSAELFALLPFGALIVAVGEDSLPAALDGEFELRHRDVGDGAEGVADPPVHGIDPSDEIDVDLPLERGDQVGQEVVG